MGILSFFKKKPAKHTENKPVLTSNERYELRFLLLEQSTYDYINSRRKCNMDLDVEEIFSSAITDKKVDNVTVNVKNKCVSFMAPSQKVYNLDLRDRPAAFIMTYFKDKATGLKRVIAIRNLRDSYDNYTVLCGNYEYITIHTDDNMVCEITW